MNPNRKYPWRRTNYAWEFDTRDHIYILSPYPLEGYVARRYRKQPYTTVPWVHDIDEDGKTVRGLPHAPVPREEAMRRCEACARAAEREDPILKARPDDED